jgi:hypothetical protein
MSPLDELLTVGRLAAVIGGAEPQRSAGGLRRPGISDTGAAAGRRVGRLWQFAFGHVSTGYRVSDV